MRESALEDDRRGIDALAVLDIGQVPIQTKSSKKGVERFLREHPGMDYEVIVFMSHLTEYDVRCITFSRLRLRRNRALGRFVPEPIRRQPLILR